MDFSERLRAIMEEHKITNYKLAKDIEVPPSLVGYWLTNKRQPVKDNLIKLADYFDVSVDYLLGRTDKPEINK